MSDRERVGEKRERKLRQHYGGNSKMMSKNHEALFIDVYMI